MTIEFLSKNRKPNRNIFAEVSLGLIDGVSSLLKFGRNQDVDSAASEDLWDAGGIWVPPTTARIHDIVSSSINDASAGTGARTVEVFGLDASFTLQNETIILNGTTNVPTVNAYIMIHRMIIRTAGSGKQNAGNVTATAQTDATITAQISIGFNQTLMAIYQVPVNKKLLLTKWYVNADKSAAAGTVDFELSVNPFEEVFQIKSHLGIRTDGNSYFERNFEPYFLIEEKSIIKINCNSSSNDTDCHGGFDGLLIDTN